MLKNDLYSDLWLSPQAVEDIKNWDKDMCVMPKPEEIQVYTDEQAALARRQRIQFSEFHGWTEINEHDMTGRPPVGPERRSALPYPGQKAAPHNHCKKCWGAVSPEVKRCPRCKNDSLEPFIVCFPENCGSS